MKSFAKLLSAIIGALILAALTASPASAAWYQNAVWTPTTPNIAATAAPGSFTPQGYSDATGSSWSLDASGHLAVVSSPGDGTHSLVRNGGALLDMQSRVNFIANASSPTVCTWLRFSVATSTGYLVCEAQATSQWAIYKVISGTSTTLGGGAMSALTTGAGYQLMGSVVQTNATTTTITVGLLAADGATVVLATQSLTDTTASLQNVTGVTGVFEGTNSSTNYAAITELATYTDVAGVYIAPNAAGIYYSPCNWSSTSNASITTNGGAYFKTIFTGASATLNFNYFNMPTNAISQIEYRIDGITWTQANVASTIALTMPTGTASLSQHLVEVALKGTTEATSPVQTINRWNIGASPSPVLIFTGLSLSTGSVITAPIASPNSLCILGDSLSEGYKTVMGTGGTSDVDWSSGRLSYATLMAHSLNAEVGVVGYGGTGYTNSGAAGMPSFPTWVNAYYAGSPARNWTGLTGVIIFLGGNDGSSNTVTNATAAFNTIAGATTTPVYVLGEATAQTANIKAAIAASARPTQFTYIPVIDGPVALPVAGVNSFDGQHPTAAANIESFAPTLAAIMKPYLSPTSAAAATPVLHPIFH